LSYGSVAVPGWNAALEATVQDTHRVPEKLSAIWPTGDQKQQSPGQAGQGLPGATTPHRSKKAKEPRLKLRRFRCARNFLKGVIGTRIKVLMAAVA